MTANMWVMGLGCLVGFVIGGTTAIFIMACANAAKISDIEKGLRARGLSLNDVLGGE